MVGEMASEREELAVARERCWFRCTERLRMKLEEAG